MSSRRTPGPIRRGLSVGRCGQLPSRQQYPVIMGPRLAPSLKLRRPIVMTPAKPWRRRVAGTTDVLGHPFEPHALAIREPCRDIAAGEAGLALRHLFLRAAQGLPPRGPMRRARQGRVDDRLDIFEAQHKFGQLLLLQIIAQRVVVVHERSRYFFMSARRASRRSARAMPKAM